MEPINMTAPRNIKRKYRKTGDVHPQPKSNSSKAIEASKFDGPVRVIGPTGKARMVNYTNNVATP